MNTLIIALSGFVMLADPKPADSDVKGGPWLFLLFVGLAIAIAFLGWSLVQQLRKTKRNAEAGVFGTDESKDD